MPKFYEVYGGDAYSTNPEYLRNRYNALCPYTKSRCDGGGNRHQTAVKLNGSILRAHFNPSIEKLVPGICSIQYGQTPWIVCPRRLFGFDPSRKDPLKINSSLTAHERVILEKCGAPTGVELGIWSEVYLQYRQDDTEINYHFDFIVAPILQRVKFSDWLDSQRILKSENKEYVDAARKGGYISGKYSDDTEVSLLPDLSFPIIIEVMTASTSGSDKSAGTDIASSFTSAISGEDHSCPGINKRQVWGRMATQLFAKSALAEQWGGKTVWVVQDELLKNIALTTKLNMQMAADSSTQSVNFLSLKYASHSCDKKPKTIFVDSYVQKSSGVNYHGSNTCIDILLPKEVPNKKELIKSVLRRKLSAITKLQ